MKQSDSINELALALSKAQGECHAATKDKANPFFKSKYATLEEIIAVLKEPLKNNGLAITQMTDFEDENLFLETQISHSSGQWIRGRYLVSPVDNKPQSLGSAITYSKRYALQAAMLVPSEDDDGNEAQKAAPAKKVKETGSAIAAEKPVERNPYTPAPPMIADLEALKVAIHNRVGARKIPAAHVKQLITLMFAPKKTLNELDLVQATKLYDKLLKEGVDA